ncbi:MAG: subclass B3 metallo-beta-lactamase [Chitinophagaceae bacterium]|nr:MAG: subclass B3 metallo-beta-lactamase [Chitinophagaceae bacterium]
MQIILKKVLLSAFVFSFIALKVSAQKVNEPTNIDSNWVKDYAPFQIAGSLYYVGTYDLACYLIATSKGNILINTGLASSARQIEKNIERLGFKFSDTKILLTTQAHYDHMGAMAAIKAATGAAFYVNAADAAAAASGGAADYEMGKYGVTFRPVTADKQLVDGEIISLGETKLTMLNHPGHTMGSCSYLLTVTDSSRSYRVLIANMPSIITDKKFENVTAYPSISSDYAYTLKALKRIKFDLWVASHASQFDLHSKRNENAVYNPAAFTDKKAFKTALADYRKSYQTKLREDKK